jgi:ubiquinone/menaquinone biosynthesis C-methylase UbiE
MTYCEKTAEEIRESMNSRYDTNTAYSLQLLWDIARMEDLNQKTMAYLGDDPGRILEVCCGQGGSAPYLDPLADYTGIDISDVAIALAQQAFPEFSYQQGDVCQLDFEDGTFNTVIAKEAIEHLLKPDRALKEWHRVLAPGGLLVLTTPNCDSLHLRINRALGHGDFLCSYDHVKEFTFSEMTAMMESAGFSIEASCGSFLMPYWGIPHVDGPVRYLTDQDPSVVEILQDLGDRVGADYGFCMVIKARRR